MKSYKFLEQVFHRIKDLDDIVNTLYYKKYNSKTLVDINELISQIHTVEEIKHEMLTNELVNEMLKTTLTNQKDLSEWEILNLNRMNKLYNHSSIVPLSMKLELAKAKIKYSMQWVVAYQNNDQKLALSSLSEIVKLVNEVATIKSDVLKISKYDTLLDSYDCNLNSKDLDVVFSDLGIFFRNFFTEVISLQSKKKTSNIRVAKDKQVLLEQLCLDCFEINKEKIFIEECDNYGYGYRHQYMNNPYHIVKNYDQNNYRNGLAQLFHNIGKIIYINKLPKNSVLTHNENIMYETMGLLISNHLLSSQEFVEFIYPHLKKIFSLRGKAANYENIISTFSQVQPNLLLRESDEISSLAHIMLRYTLEKEIMNDVAQIKYLPDIWLQGMQFYYNIMPNSNYEGFMQDNLWIDGIFGYFPCLTIANLTATQIFYTIKETQKDIFTNIKNGNFSALLAWLENNIYTEKLNNFKNKDLDSNIYKKYLVEKYINNS